MNCIVIGAGNAGRPAARILKYAGFNVTIRDKKLLEEFTEDEKKILLKMEEEGVKLSLGSDIPEELENFDQVYISPTIPRDSPIRQTVIENHIKIIKDEYIGKIIDEEMDIDVIGITGSVGKTTTTLILSDIFKSAGYKVWTCSSQQADLLSEVIVDGIVRGYHKENEIAVLELPHGTLRLLSPLNLKVGVLTNIFPEHLTEFNWSMDEYVARKLLIVNMCDVLVANEKSKDFVKSVRDEVVWYCSGEDDWNDCNVFGEASNGKIKIKYNLSEIKGEFESDFKMILYYVENAIAAAAAAISYGLSEKDITQALSDFNGVPGRMEYLGKHCHRELYFDAAHLPEVLEISLKFFSGRPLVVLIDNPDGITVRDKKKIGKILGKYAKVIIASGYNESIKNLDMYAAWEVLIGAEDSEAIKIAVENLENAGELSIKYSKPGDIILHVGPGALSAYRKVKSDMLSGIEGGCAKYG
ncbi:MAG: UDP-N-acetylmuramoyl-L-alanine--D-glutamate ligase [Euryarchaeota archaeon]|nr:UDP-N-acetylmuramoyl-L-alanine--D-glutamate ligase [Euryarchaeota archaeon]